MPPGIWSQLIQRHMAKRILYKIRKFEISPCVLTHYPLNRRSQPSIPSPYETYPTYSHSANLNNTSQVHPRRIMRGLDSGRYGVCFDPDLDAEICDTTVSDWEFDASGNCQPQTSGP